MESNVQNLPRNYKKPSFYCISDDELVHPTRIIGHNSGYSDPILKRSTSPKSWVHSAVRVWWFWSIKDLSWWSKLRAKSEKGKKKRQKSAVSRNFFALKITRGSRNSISSWPPGLACKISGHYSCFGGIWSCFHDFHLAHGLDLATIRQIPCRGFSPMRAGDTQFWFWKPLVLADNPEQLLRPNLPI